MIRSSHLELAGSDQEGLSPAVQEMATETSTLNASATTLAHAMAWLPGQVEKRPFHQRCLKLARALRPVFAVIQSPPARNASGDIRSLHENILLLRSELEDVSETFSQKNKLPQVRVADGEVIPRIAALAEDYLAAASCQFRVDGFSDYIQSFQEVTVLNLNELWTLIPAMKLVLLEQIAMRSRRLLRDPDGAYGIHEAIGSLRDIRQTTWKFEIEPLIRFDRILQEDPSGTYARMDYESRDLYRNKLVKLADRSDCSEMEVAKAAIVLAREAQKQSHSDPRVGFRRSHVGTYLLAEGRPLLKQRIDHRANFTDRVPTFLRSHPDEFYLPGIAVLTLLMVLGIVLFLTDASTSLGLILLSTLAILLPSSQSAVQIMNYLAAILLPAEILPKLDFLEGLPADCVTMVAIPTLLLNQKQVHKLVDDLEVRFLGNHDPNLHFALLTDLPDSPEKPAADNPLVDLCADLIRGLNEKYFGKDTGSFFLLHRHSVYNPRERLWMGWERKRGKLIDLNSVLRAQFDSFPVKIGDLSIFPSVRFVITLDSDTELPRGSAFRMVGAMAHPLNQAIVDAERGIVASGYGILQPRVGVSVQSSARSRLASIYSGQTGLDIYTRAASDVYQDLYGEGIFVGKGIYEVDTLRRVLDRRFPRNALLSHDLVEGAYARAGLVSDVEIIEDYPSHYSAHNRRKHRWLRGDWQIAEWLRPRVPDESGQQVANPLSVVSRWKIFDNLRRSLVEPALFTLFVLGWLCLPGRPAAWTVAAVAVLFLPAFVQLGFELAAAGVLRKFALALDAFQTFANACIADWLTITFLAHQALLSMDAMVRTLVRRMITRQRLLQWETAAQAELAGYKRTILDIYLNSTPLLAAGVFALVWFLHRTALPVAPPILLLWAFSKPISIWLNRPPRSPRKPVSERNQWLLRLTALRTWRYFSEFSTEQHHWLIPDNVQEENVKIAPRISPTNLGLLLNARQVACEFGYLTVPEFAQQTLRTLETASSLKRHRGHLLNWYDTQTLEPLAPAFVSSVDSGNLAASLWTLQRGCLELISQPLLQPELPAGFLDHLYVLASLRSLPRGKFSVMKKSLEGEDWLPYLLDIPDEALKDIHHSASPKHESDARWFQGQAEERISQICRVAQLYAPWLLPEFAAMKNDPTIYRQGRSDDAPTLKQMPDFIDTLAERLKAAHSAASSEVRALSEQLLALLPDARSHVVRLIEDLKKIAARAGTLVDEMDFDFLYHRGRGLLSVGFDADRRQLQGACYDLLASEARIATFVAIAKDDVPQDTWFHLGRVQTLDQGMAGLLSWTGTMFEYMMPALWMRIYPNTLLERAGVAALRSQRAYAADAGIPWGISESACFETDASGNYQYHAFGVPGLAIHKVDLDGPVVSPYSAFLALPVDPATTIKNLRKLQRKGALGTFGFYEALDYNPERSRSRLKRFELVRSWMAHHQGMSLLSIANFLHQDIVQRWFHSHPRVQATELLLQEKPASRPRSPRVRNGGA